MRGRISAPRFALPTSLALLPAALLLISTPVIAQTGGSGFFSLGTIDLNLDDLNRRLVAADLPAAESSALTFGGGGWNERGRLRLGGQGHGFLNSEETTEDGRTGVRLSGGYGIFSLGWEVYRGSRVTLFPVGGIGGGGYSLHIGTRESALFDDILEDPRRSSTLSAGGILTSAGIRGEIALGERSARGRPRPGPILGVEATALRGIGNWSWSSQWGAATRGPDVAFDGVHLRVTFGGGIRR